MPVRRVFAVCGAVLLGTLVLAAPAAADATVQPSAADAYELSAGRLGAIVAALLALGGVVMGGLALARPAARRRAAVAAVAAGLVAMAAGGLVVGTADGGLGTGNGLGGGVVALLIGLLAALLGTLGLARARRTTGRTAGSV